jgi:hypothetical protein
VSWGISSSSYESIRFPLTSPSANSLTPSTACSTPKKDGRNDLPICIIPIVVSQIVQVDDEPDLLEPKHAQDLVPIVVRRVLVLEELGEHSRSVLGKVILELNPV